MDKNEATIVNFGRNRSIIIKDSITKMLKTYLIKPL